MVHSMLDFLHNCALNPIPSGAVVHLLRADDGIRLRAAHWPALTASPKGTVCLFQGRTEFIEKYFETIADLRQRGFAVAVLDWRGQGGSQRLTRNPRKGHISSFSHYQRDIDVFMRDLVLPDCPLPLFGLGHSMGGAILIDALNRLPNRFDRAVLSSPMIGLAGFGGSDSAHYLARIMRMAGMGRVMIPSHAKALSFETNDVTRDHKRFTRNVAVAEEEPRLAIGAPTFGWLDSSFKMTARFENADFIARIRTPLLVVTGGADRVVSNVATARFVRRLRVAKMITLDGSRHELMMETDPIRAAFFAAFDAFIPGRDHFAVL
jgi:lysophospholipase